MEVRIFEVVAADAAYVEPIQKLLGQLSSSPVVFTLAELQALVADTASSLFLLECDGAVAGMLTLSSYLAPTGRKLWIEDVVVDSAMRGKALGRRLVERAVERAREKGGTLMLTSKPARVAANTLYRSLDFKPKETNVYKMDV